MPCLRVRVFSSRCSSAANTGEFVALTLAQPSTPLSPSDIRIELRRGATTMSIYWPIQGGGECAAWLRE